MSMQPRLMAETLGPVVPSLRCSMVALLESRWRTFRAVMTRPIWTFSIESISWTIINGLFSISDNEKFRPPRPRCFRRRGAHAQFPPRRGGAGRLRLEPQPAAARHGGAAWRPPDEPHHAQRSAHRSRRAVAGPNRPRDI